MSSTRSSVPSEVFGGFCSLLGLPLGHISAGLPLLVQSGSYCPISRSPVGFEGPASFGNAA
jgi:hypothetical protein